MKAMERIFGNGKVTDALMPYLTDPRLVRELAYINGQWVHGRSDSPVFNPATNDVIGHVPRLDAEQVTHAVDAAQTAFADWRGLMADERAALLMRWHDLILEHKEDLATLMVLEQGKPRADAQGEIDYGASFVRWFAEEGRRACGDTIPSHIPGAKLLTQREPVGVAALITPWNFPHAMITRKAAAALAIGCTLVIKPASETPFSALALAELAERAGFAPGVINVITGAGAELGEALCRDDRVRALSFTGSTQVGKQLLAACANTVKKCAMELGGNAPFIVLPDMDLKEAAQAAVAAKFQTAGQDCLAANRILVPRAHYEEFLDAFAGEMARIRVGNGLEAGVTMGPLIHRRAVENAQALVDDALAHGARLFAGNKHTGPGENFFLPVLLADVTPAMRVFREETFCPVAAVLPYDDTNQLLTLANDTEYGLAAYVFGHDQRQIWPLLDGLEFGMVAVNSVKMTGHCIPFGGIKHSGLGREGSRHGFDDFSNLKYACLGGL
ncbi:NAD-dependent succinate-semialdehyde dehydrogenase [Oceanimonas sp. CHS3-5]|uniref:NAD-dependent succinate-semialdehyde dehydrogenase n=1 Tax=Oceanimonas sp. CHS3-5 TaxID=3068186 RepID=UPI00273E1B90|nr:NAD-dependent succinate-semialdehyde dehydrogenase [Oceanimonas sp. CHS3-5]MDP5292142.1 NAD-dependent succinate-semialdehyde dehydrogenase [Oceanimonas sp. CHS3-5]